MSRSNVEIARRAYAAINAGDIDTALECVHPEIEWHMSHRFEEGRVFHGHDGVRDVFGMFLAMLDDFRAEPKEFIDAGNKVIVRVRLCGKEKTGGEDAAYDLVQVWTARDGKAARLDVYDTRAEALRSLGVT